MSAAPGHPQASAHPGAQHAAQSVNATTSLVGIAPIASIAPAESVAPVAPVFPVVPVTARRIIVAISGASGAVYGVRLLQALRAAPGVQTHLVVSDAGWRNVAQEQGMARAEVEALAHQVHDVRNVGASIASGSFQCSGMVIAPCSMRTLAAVAHGLADNLLTRAADVMLKERRKLVLMVRESPLHLGHLRNMVSVTEMGAIVCPPMPAFYLRPQTVADVVDASVARVLDLLDVPHNLAARWDGQGAA